MESKKSFEIYRVGKGDIRKEIFYDSTEGSALLFEARAGCLRKRSYKNKHTKENNACVGCRKEIETIEHIIIERASIPPDVYGRDVHVHEALGSKDSGGKENWAAVVVNKYWNIGDEKAQTR